VREIGGMATSRDTAGYPQAILDEVSGLADECALCLQCGECTSACPSGRELYHGPRRIVRLLLAGEVGALLKSDDLWRCTGCGACTQHCRMGIDIAGVLQRLRALERECGQTAGCPERSAADIATGRLKRRGHIDGIQFGIAMLTRGHVPKDKVGAAGMGVRLGRRFVWKAGTMPAAPMWTTRAAGVRTTPVGRAGKATDESPGALTGDAETLPFYAGCAVTQDRELHELVHEVAAGFGVRLDEEHSAACCGHPSRGAIASLFHADGPIRTACPACDAGLEEAGMEAVPLWDTLTERGRRNGIALAASADRFVPYVGCLAERDRALAALGAAADQSGSVMEFAYPSLHNGCCGALGGMYRGATEASVLLLDFAAARRAPVVTTCVLCRDNLRSAARQLKREVTVHLWPEFFRAATRETPIHE
jgi:ferredoxin